MQKTAILVLMTLTAAGAFAGDFEKQLSVGTQEIKIAAETDKTQVQPIRIAQFQAPDPGWWKGPDAERVKFKFGKLSVVSDQIRRADPFTMIGAQYSACFALQEISYEGTIDPDNINRVINWMLNNVDGLRGQIQTDYRFVEEWSKALETPGVIMTPVTHCIAEHSKYLMDRMLGVAGYSISLAAAPAKPQR